MLLILGILLAIFTVILIWVTNKVGIGEIRLPHGCRVLAHKLLFSSQVIGLFIVKLVKFDTRNVVLCVDIRIVVFSSMSIQQNQKCVIVSCSGRSPQHLSVKNQHLPCTLFSAAFKEKNNLFFVILKFQAG